jgi:hypothetical protein
VPVIQELDSDNETVIGENNAEQLPFTDFTEEELNEATEALRNHFNDNKELYERLFFRVCLGLFIFLIILLIFFFSLILFVLKII